MRTAWEVQVVDERSKELVKRILCTSEHAADRVERGLSINLNHRDYSVQVVEIQVAVTKKESTR